MGHTIWKSILIGAVYALSVIFAGMVLQIGLTMPEATGDMRYIFAAFFASGVLLAAFLGPLVRSLKLTVAKSFSVLLRILYLNAAAVAIEGAFFAPRVISKDILPAVLLQQFIVALLAALAVAWLFRPKKRTSIVFIYKGGWFQWAWRLLASSAGYAGFYYIFRNIGYKLAAEVYDKANMGGLSVPGALDILKIEPVRGLLMVLSVLPLILFSDWSRTVKAILAGGVLFVVGGVVPLMAQIHVLPKALLIASGIEIFFQNFLTGALTAFLFSPGYSESRDYYF